MSGDSHRLNYFMISTPLGHISHLHDWLIAKRPIFDMEKYDRPTTSGWFLTWIGFDI